VNKSEEDNLINDYFSKYKCDFGDRRNLAIIRSVNRPHLVWMIENIVNVAGEKRLRFYETLSSRFPDEIFYIPSDSKFFKGFFHINENCLPPIRRDAHSWRIDPMVYMNVDEVDLDTLTLEVALPCSSCFYDFLDQQMKIHVQ
jgi:hypothetical protein